MEELAEVERLGVDGGPDVEGEELEELVGVEKLGVDGGPDVEGEEMKELVGVGRLCVDGGSDVGGEEIDGVSPLGLSSRVVVVAKLEKVDEESDEVLTDEVVDTSVSPGKHPP
jgi:hypothetical protein